VDGNIGEIVADTLIPERVVKKILQWARRSPLPLYGISTEEGVPISPRLPSWIYHDVKTHVAGTDHVYIEARSYFGIPHLRVLALQEGKRPITGKGVEILGARSDNVITVLWPNTKHTFFYAEKYAGRVHVEGSLDANTLKAFLNELWNRYNPTAIKVLSVPLKVLQKKRTDALVLLYFQKGKIARRVLRRLEKERAKLGLYLSIIFQRKPINNNV